SGSRPGRLRWSGPMRVRVAWVTLTGSPTGRRIRPAERKRRRRARSVVRTAMRRINSAREKRIQLLRRWWRQHQDGFGRISYWTWWTLVALTGIVVLLLLVAASLISIPFSLTLLFTGAFPSPIRIA